MQNIVPFDPTASPSNSFIAHLPNGGWLLVINESVVGLQLFFPNTGFKSTVPPYCMRMMRLTIPLERVEWSQAYTIAGGPLNTVVGEVYEQSEWTGGEFLIPLPRLVNIGNQVSTTGSAGIKNDGNNPGTQFIESTPNDQGISAISINNDGSSVWKILSANVQRIFLSLTRGNTGVTKASIQIGDSGDTSITTLYGTVGVGSVVPGPTVTGDIAANQVGPGALDTDVTMGAGQVQPGGFPAGHFTMGSNTGNTALDLQSQTSGVNGDCLNLINGKDSTYFATMGMGDPTASAFGAGIWAYDQKNGGYIFKQGTKSFIVFNGYVASDANKFVFNNANGSTGEISADTTNHFLNVWAPAPAGISYHIDFHPWNGTTNGASLHLDGSGRVEMNVMDNALNVYKRRAVYIGATDPATYTTVNDGDEWIQA